MEVVTGILDTFIVEPFVPHEQSDEYYVCINSNREGEEFLFCHEGGVDVGDVDAKADRLQVGQGTILNLVLYTKRTWPVRSLRTRELRTEYLISSKFSFAYQHMSTRTLYFTYLYPTRALAQGPSPANV